jgi:hypothetical protein
MLAARWGNPAGGFFAYYGKAITCYGCCMDHPPTDPTDHAQDFAYRWRDKLDECCTLRMQGLGIPDEHNGASDFDRTGDWRAFDWRGRNGGNVTTGVYVNSGVLNPDLLKGQKGGRIWPKARLRDRLDAVIAHEWEELKTADHGKALRTAPKTELPISDEARRICRAMAR